MPLRPMAWIGIQHFTGHISYGQVWKRFWCKQSYLEIFFCLITFVELLNRNTVMLRNASYLF